MSSRWAGLLSSLGLATITASTVRPGLGYLQQQECHVHTRMARAQLRCSPLPLCKGTRASCGWKAVLLPPALTHAHTSTHKLHAHVQLAYVALLMWPCPPCNCC